MQNKLPDRKANPEEIEKLYTFTRQHYVEYHDLQTELVDHLATGIEQNWEEDPSLDFEKNLNIEFKKFGVFGFMNVIEQKQKAITKKYFMVIRMEVKNQLSSPSLAILFISLVIAGGYLLQWKISFLIFGIGLLAMCIYILIKTAKFRQKMKNQEKVYFLESVLLQGGGFVTIILFPVYVFNIINPFLGSEGSSSLFLNWIFSFLFMSCALICWVSFFILPHKKEEILNNFYPERKLPIPK